MAFAGGTAGIAVASAVALPLVAGVPMAVATAAALPVAPNTSEPSLGGEAGSAGFAFIISLVRALGGMGGHHGLGITGGFGGGGRRCSLLWPKDLVLRWWPRWRW